MLCKNKKCNKGNFDKRCKFEPERIGQVCCSVECAIELIQSKTYVNQREKEIRVKNVKEKKILMDKWGATAYLKENKKYLQNEINKLARLIDAKFGYETCICCHRGFGAQCDGCHYHSTGSNASLRYNLANIHSGSSYCNDYSNTHITGYKEGLATRYGIEYQDYVVNQLPLIYKEIHLSAHDIVEKLAIVRKIIRGLDKVQFKDAIEARDVLNEQIGIYTKKFGD